MKRVPQIDRVTARGSTLIELLAVVVVLATIATLVVSRSEDSIAACDDATTATTMTSLRDAIAGSVSRGHDATPGYLADVGKLPLTISDLLRKPSSIPAFDVDRGIGWRGPYVSAPSVPFAVNAASGFTAVYAMPGDPVVLDAWQRPIVLQVPDANGDGTPETSDFAHARLVSAGRNGVIETPRTDAASASGSAYFPSLAACGDDVVLYVKVADQRQ